MKSTVATLAQSPFGNFKVSNYKPRSVDLNAKGPGFVSFGTNFGFSTKKFQPLVSKAKSGSKRIGLGSRSFAVVRASISPESGGSEEPIAPLQLESPIGQFLSRILVSHPHLVPAAVEKQLEQLQTDLDLEKNEDTSSSSSAGTDLVLYRRIAELKANERKKTLEEILYTLVVQKFMDANVSLVPSIAPSSSDTSGRVDSWPSQDESLKQLHSPEAYEMIQNHLSLILGNRITDSTSVAQISKLRVGQVYAASVMYGYFLKRVDQRFQLEKSMKVLPNSLVGDENEEEESIDGVSEILGQDTRPVGGPSSHPEVSSWGAGGVSAAGSGSSMRTSRLRTYVMSFDGETLQRYATIRSKEAVSIIEKHTEALFGRPEIVITPEGTIDSSKDEVIKISFGGLKRLILEAVTFGSFLWDVESYVDARYHFMLS